MKAIQAAPKMQIKKTSKKEINRKEKLRTKNAKEEFQNCEISSYLHTFIIIKYVGKNKLSN